MLNKRLLITLLSIYTPLLLLGQNVNKSIDDDMYIVDEAFILANNLPTLGRWSKNQFIIQSNAVSKDKLSALNKYSILKSSQKYDIAEINNGIRIGDEYLVNVKFTKDITLLNIHDVINPLGVSLHSEQKWSKNNIFQLKVSYSQLQKLSNSAFVLHIGGVYEDHTLNQEMLGLVNVNEVTKSISLGGKGLTGKGVNVAIGDDGALSHVDVLDRVLAEYNPALGTSHGGHVAGLMAGNGNVDQRFKGIAPGANIVNTYFSGVLAYQDALYKDWKINITNNSYANVTGNCSVAGTYTVLSQAVDELSITYPKILNIFAAGNDGSRICAPLTDGFGTTVGAYQCAKNALVVANLGKSIQSFTANSSKGPIKDGRIKPEITAIGTRLNSNGFNQTYYFNSGTSMSTPNVVGGAAILTEAFQNIYGKDSLPDALLIKNILINGTQDIGNVGPDYKWGFGLMDVAKSVDILQNAQFKWGNIKSGIVDNINIDVPDNKATLKILLTWDDLPATPTPADHSISKLIHDLDLKVVDPDGNLVLPLVLNAYNPNDVAVNGVDSINNVEQIVINNPKSGKYKIEVSSAYISADSVQKYLVSWCWDNNELKITSPTYAESFINDDTISVYFKSPLNGNKHQIFLSTDNGVKYQTIVSDLAADQRHFVYKLSDTIQSDQCRIVVKQDKTDWVDTSEIFTISSRIQLTVLPDSIQCPGSITVKWNAIPKVNGYVTYILENGNMIPKDTVDGTINQFTFADLDPNKEYLIAVAPLFNTQVGIRSVGLYIKPNKGSCKNTDLKDDNLTIVSFASPTRGRALTSSSLSGNHIINLNVQNRGKNIINSAKFSLWNNDVLESNELFELNILPGKDAVIAFEKKLNLNSIGEYSIKAIMETVNSAVKMDSLVSPFVQLSNDTIPAYSEYIENFETASVFEIKDLKYIGLPGLNKWDFEKDKGYGRIRSFVNSDVPVNGIRALSMDLDRHFNAKRDSISMNAAIVNLNLSHLDINKDVVRTDVFYRFAGKPRLLNTQSIYVRGSDKDPWIFVNYYDTTLIGYVKQLPYLELNNILQTNGQNFSTSTQLKYTQKDSSMICGIDFGKGLTIDSFRVYAVTNDVSVEQIIEPAFSATNWTDENIVITVKNNVLYPIHNVLVNYSLNGLANDKWDTIPVINPKSVVNHTFSTKAFLDRKGKYDLQAFVKVEGDSYSYNDTFSQQLHHQLLIDEFPYYTSFEEDIEAGTFYTNDSSYFVCDTPNTRYTKQAANGSKAFVSNGLNSDTVKSQSYIYTPYFKTKDLKNPYISFNMACNLGLMDSSVGLHTSAWVEYTLDGSKWIKLGNHSSGYNWYNDELNYWAYYNTDWKVATHELPRVESIQLRFVLDTYLLNSSRSFDIDDIHVYDTDYSIDFVNNNIIGAKNEFDLFVNENHIIAHSIRDFEKITQVNDSNVLITQANIPVLPTHYYIHDRLLDHYNLDVYIPHQSFQRYIESSCTNCMKETNIMNLAVTNYSDENQVLINSNYEDNNQLKEVVIDKSNVWYTPFRNGYKVSLKNIKSGELWWHTNNLNQSVSFNPIQLSGQQINNNNVKLNWITKNEDQFQLYELFRVNEDYSYVKIYESGINSSMNGSYTFIDMPFDQNLFKYQLRYTDINNIQRWSNVISFYREDRGMFNIFPNPTLNNTLYVSYDIVNANNLSWRLLDVLGKVLMEADIELENNRGIFPINLQQFASGNYFLELITPDQKQSVQIVHYPNN